MRKFALIALLLSLCIGGAALAQGVPTFCGTLSDADCAILTNSQNASKTLDSASFDLTINATVTNVPDMTEPLTFSLVGSGSYAGASGLQADAMNMISAAHEFDPAQFYVNLLDKLDADLTLTLALPPQLLRESGSTMPGNITLQARLVDGVGYINFDTLQPVLNQPNLKGWGGLDLAGLLKAALQQNPDLFQGMNGMGAATNGTDMSALMHQFTDPQFLNQFLTITRTDTGSGDTATFHMTIDFAAMMSSPAMHDLMMREMQMQGRTMTDAEIQQAMAMSAQMMQGMSMSLDEEVGITDGFVHSVRGTFAFDTSGMMSAMQTPSAASTSEPAPSVTVDFALNYSAFNSAPAITAPENASLIPYQMLLGMMMPTPAATVGIPPTLLPTATPSGTPEATAEPTAEMTAEPTTEVTGEPTAEVTLMPTAETTLDPIDVTLEPTAELQTGG
jgi:hypothetical protein